MASEADGPSNANRSKIEIQLLHNRLPIQNKTLRGQCSNVYFAELQTKLQTNRASQGGNWYHKLERGAKFGEREQMVNYCTARGGMSIVELENCCARLPPPAAQ
jgi:hypothetical protein